MLSDIRYGRFVNMPSGRFLSLKLTNSRIRRVGPLGMEELELMHALEELGITIKYTARWQPYFIQPAPSHFFPQNSLRIWPMLAISCNLK